MQLLSFLALRAARSCLAASAPGTRGAVVACAGTRRSIRQVRLEHRIIMPYALSGPRQRRPQATLTLCRGRTPLCKTQPTLSHPDMSSCRTWSCPRRRSCQTGRGCNQGPPSSLLCIPHQPPGALKCPLQNRKNLEFVQGKFDAELTDLAGRALALACVRATFATPEAGRAGVAGGDVFL